MKDDYIIKCDEETICDNCKYNYCPQCADEMRGTEMTDREILDALLQVIGSYTYGKERWFREHETTVWYDRATGKYIDAESMINNVMSAIKEVSYD